MRRFLAVCFALFSLGAWPSNFAADKPTLEYLFPAGAGIGTTNEITFFGKFDPWPPKFWSDSDQILIEPSTNKGKATLRIATNATPAAHLIRLYNESGASDPAIFVIGNQPELVQQKTEPLTLDPGQLPVTINGRLEKRGDAHSYILPIKAGQWLDAKLDSYILMGKLDAVLRLLDDRGHELAMNHDWATLDPRLIWRSPIDQTVTLQAFGFIYPANSEIQLYGGEGAIYRLHLNLSSDQPPDLNGFAPRANHSATNASPLDPGAAIPSLISNAGEEDFYLLQAKKDDWYEITTRAASLGSSLDPWLVIRDESGKQLARDDDTGYSRDPRLEWKVPADGKFFAVVGSVTHQAGPDFRYSISAKKLAPDFEAKISANAFEFSPGTTNSLKFNFKLLRGFTNEVTASLDPLPEGISCEPKTIPLKDGEVELSVNVSSNAPPTNAPFRILIKFPGTDSPRAVQYYFTTRSENNGVPGGYTTLLVEKTENLWLTIKPKPPEPEKKQ